MAYMSLPFSRIRENEAKIGTYYTDTAHCKDIRKLFLFPEEEVCALDPDIGDGNAVITVTGAHEKPSIKIFGVELNDTVADHTKQNPYITDVLKADFTNGVMIQKNCFSFAFGNPPYLTEKNDTGEKDVRLERVFLDKIVNYLKIGAILVWVVPYNTFCDISYIRLWIRDFDTEAIYKFREPEYSKYHQIVIIGRKIHRRANLTSQIQEYIQHWNLSNLKELPNDLKPCIEVFPSLERDIEIFTTKVFDAKAAYDFLKSGPPDDIIRAFDRQVAQTPYNGGTLKCPPITPKKDSKYLLVTSGFSDGAVGSVEDNNLHMMRGVANVVEHCQYNYNDEGEEESVPGTITVTTSTEVELRVLENDGKITVLN